jgi:hypothetical protein
LSIPEFEPVPAVDEWTAIESEYERLNNALVAARGERIRVVSQLDSKVAELASQVHMMRRRVAAARERRRLGGA